MVANTSHSTSTEAPGGGGNGNKPRRFRHNCTVTVALCAQCGKDMPKQDNHELCARCIQRAAPRGPGNSCQRKVDKHSTKPSPTAQDGGGKQNTTPRPPMPERASQHQSARNKDSSKFATTRGLRKLAALARALHADMTAKSALQQVNDNTEPAAECHSAEPIAIAMPALASAPSQDAEL